MNAIDSKVLRRRELAEFLRSRRARISPHSLGLAVSKLRRSSGLRRDEVSRIAGVSVSWYTWLEQGRNIAASSGVLDRIANALQLSDGERTHLFELAGQPPPSSSGSETVSPLIRSMLDTLEITPAYVCGTLWDILAWNEACSAVYDFGGLEPEDRNLVRFMFCEPRARRLFADWDLIAQRVVARFRMSVGPFLGEAKFRSFIEELGSRSAEFRDLWGQKQVMLPSASRRELHHEILGSLVFDQHVLDMNETSNLQLVLDSPVPATGTREKIRNTMSKS